MPEKLTKRDIKVTKKNPFFEMQGISHTAFVSGDMAKTVEFYQGVLGMELVMAQEAAAPGSDDVVFQHFFFDCGGGDTIGFVWMEQGTPNPASQTVDGLTHGGSVMGAPGLDGSLHHIAIKVPEEKFVEYSKALTEKGIEYAMIVHDVDSSLGTTTEDIKDTTYAASVYFRDPDGIVVEFCSWLPAIDQMERSAKGVSRKNLVKANV